MANAQLKAATERFQRATNALKSLTGSKGILEQFSKKFESLARMAKESKRIHAQIAKQLTGSVRQMLAQNYAASGIHNHSGDLQRAAVQTAVVDVTDKGIVVRFGPGNPQKVYVQGAALNYGAVHGGGLGAKTKKTLKKAAKLKAGADSKEVGSGVTVTPPHPFFFLSSDQIASLQDQYIALWQIEVNKVVGRK